MNVDSAQLKDVAKRVLLPAVLGGAGGGALSAYMSSKAQPKGETPQDRRRRILRNALVGMSLGGVAGATIPTGFKMLTDPYFGKAPISSPFQRAGDAAIRNLGLTGGLAGAGLYEMGTRGQEKTKALQHLFENISAGDKATIPNVATLTTRLKSSPDARRNFIDSILQAKGVSGTTGFKEQLRLGEMMEMAGHKAPRLADMSSVAGHPISTPGQATRLNETVLNALKEHLAEHSHVPGRWGPSGIASWLVGKTPLGLNGTEIADWYRRQVLPSTRTSLESGSRFVPRLGRLGRLGALGAGVYATNKLWNTAWGD